VLLATTVLNPDEKALVLVEMNKLSPDYRSLRRYQLVYVLRGDNIAEHRTDLGPASAFKAPEVRIPSMWEHSVGELWDIAEDYRLADDYGEKITRELAASSTLIQDSFNWMTELINIRDNRSVVGPGFRRQRNGFSRKATT
jgi:hypothetical protein